MTLTSPGGAPTDPTRSDEHMEPTAPVLLRPADTVGDDDTAYLDRLLADTPADDRDLEAHVAFAHRHGAGFPLPGSGRTALRWEALASLGAHGLQLARTVEPHTDALAVLAEADQQAVAGATWGVYAAEAPGARLEATPTGDHWSLTGDKAWCSLADHVTHALVTAWAGETRGLFQVDLRQSSVVTDEAPWVSRGLADVRSTGLRCDAAVAYPVGAPGWYLERDGFVHGGAGVAAVWYGAAVALSRRLAQPGGREPDQVLLMHRGAVEADLHAARTVLADAADAIDRGIAGGPAGVLVAGRARLVVADCCERVLTRVEHALGPQPLVAEERHAARVADLRTYLRQHHAERDAAALGRLLTTAAASSTGTPGTGDGAP